MEEAFDDIRSYRDHEASDICNRLFTQPQMKGLLKTLLPDFSDEKIQSTIGGIKTLYDFQHEVILPIMQKNIITTFDELTVSGLENLDNTSAYLFISNHRDIVLDSALLNYFLHINDFSTAEIAIGDNLLKEKWIEDLVRLNKSFIVKRGLDNMEMLRASKKLSEYIKDTIRHRNESVWIAQRAGRAKDGNDETNKGLITMFGMSAEGKAKEHFAALNIVPVSVSYELDPCDGRKAKEIYIERNHGAYMKSEAEDVESMKMGIVLPKGKGHIHFGKPINDKIMKLPDFEKKSGLTGAIAELIDEQIQSEYRLWPTNFIANDMLGQGKGEKSYNSAEKDMFSNRLEDIINGIDGDAGQVREIVLGMYQQPLINYQKRNKGLVSA